VQTAAPPRTIWQSTALFTLAVLACACKAEQNTVPPGARTAPVSQIVPEATSVEPAAYRGATIARQICVQCHDVGVADAKPIMDVGAPTFASIANSSDTAPSALKDRMSRSHPTLPSYALGEGSFEDISPTSSACANPADRSCLTCVMGLIPTHDFAHTIWG
jgi:cytochrome c5